MDAAVIAVVGREEELRAARMALEGVESAVVVFRGEPGIGKTTLWENVAAGAGRRLLVARPIEAERMLAIAAVADMVHPFADEVLPELPPPQRRALTAALLLTETGETPVDPRTLGAALVSTMRIVGGEHGALFAVDDFQWADAASRAAFDFALRRLSAARASALLAVRTGEPDAQLPAFDPKARAVVIDLRPLTLGATDRLLTDQLGKPLQRSLLRRVHTASGGNPLYALEIARALRDARDVSTDDELPVPADLSALLRERIRPLARSTRSALAAAAALADSRVEVIEGEGDLQPALDAGLVRIEGGRVRFTHPLLASAALSLLTPAKRADLHRRLAAVVTDVEQRARHLALGRRERDEAVAVVLEAAAAQALARGAPLAASDLLELAVERTANAERRAPRLVAAATAYWHAGESDLARPLAEAAVSELPAGPERAHALILLSNLRRDHLPTALALAEQAWDEAGDDAVARALAAMRASFASGMGGDGQRSLEFARRAVRFLDELPDATLAPVVAESAFMELAATGRVSAELLARGLAAERFETLGGGREVRSILAIKLLFDERYDEARSALEELAAELETLGYESRLADALCLLSEVETRSGHPARGAEIAAHATAISADLGMSPVRLTMGSYWRALAAAYLGREEEVRELTEEGRAAAGAVGDFAFEVQQSAVLGFLELSLGNADAAIAILQPTFEQVDAVAPGMHPMHVPVLPNLIEALLAGDRRDEALVYLERLERRGRELDSGWALSQAYRARGILAAGAGDNDEAVTWFERALTEHERTGPFERARTLLAYGSALRRARRWQASRDALTAARTAFDQMGAALWAASARGELERVGGRRAGAGLTASEERVAHLVAAGRTNKQIAGELFVTVRTVETHLTRIYSKLDVRSRAELAGRIKIVASHDSSPPPAS